MQVLALNTKPMDTRDGEVDILMGKLDRSVLVRREDADAVGVEIYEAKDTGTDLVRREGDSR